MASTQRLLLLPQQPRERPILNNVTLSAAPGEKIAIVGSFWRWEKHPSFSLCLRFYTPSIRRPLFGRD
jgi:ABC-type transport system involved in Fe-S cluster assembly fused permease/ATPase subunit